GPVRPPVRPAGPVAPVPPARRGPPGRAAWRPGPGRARVRPAAAGQPDGAGAALPRRGHQPRERPAPDGHPATGTLSARRRSPHRTGAPLWTLNVLTSAGPQP